MIRHCAALTVVAVGLGGCVADDYDRWFDTTPDATYMDQMTTMESPPTSSDDAGWDGYHSKRVPSYRSSDSTWNDRASRDERTRRDDTDRTDAERRRDMDRNRDTDDRDRTDAERRRDMDRNRDTDDRDGAAARRDGTAADITEEAKVLSILHLKNQKEIEAGRLAQSRGDSQAVRDYGEKMVREHSEADERVQEVARQANVRLLSKDELHRAMDPDKQREKEAQGDPITRLRSLNGAEFDREFSTMMREGHAELIDKVEDCRGRVRDQRVRTFLDDTLRMLREHQDAASRLPAT